MAGYMAYLPTNTECNGYYGRLAVAREAAEVTRLDKYVNPLRAGLGQRNVQTASYVHGAGIGRYRTQNLMNGYERGTKIAPPWVEDHGFGKRRPGKLDGPAQVTTASQQITTPALAHGNPKRR